MSLVRGINSEINFFNTILTRAPIATILHNTSNNILLPDNFLLCDGAVLSTLLYPELFSRIGYMYGGSFNNFNLPDMRGRIPIGAGTKSLGSTNTSKTLINGHWSGSFTHDAHSHSLTPWPPTAIATPPSHVLTGGDSENLPMYMSLNAIICYDDIPDVLIYGLTRKSSKSLSYYKNKIKSLIGTIAWYASSTIPDHWLLCDGSSTSRTTYSKLFNVISNAWGNGDGTNTFNIPNFNNYMMCSYNSMLSLRNNLNPGPKTKTPNNPLVVSSHTVHNHNYGPNYAWPSMLNFGPTSMTPFGGFYNMNAINYSVGNDNNGPHGHTFSGGDAETVPDNVCGNYIIRVK